jgi:hypothetical protein
LLLLLLLSPLLLLSWQLHCQLLQESPVHQPHSSSSPAGHPPLPTA